MLKQNKKFNIFNPQLVSGSGDSLRDELGLSISVSDSGEISVPTETGLPPVNTLLSKYVFSEPSLNTNESLIYSTDHVLRLFGDENKIKDDKQWLSYINGGTFSEELYSGIYVEGAFLDHRHSEDIPYTIMETKLNNTINTGAPNVISIKPNLKHFYSRYNSYTGELQNIREIPNVYEFLNNLPEIEKDSIKEELNFKTPNGLSEVEGVSQELLTNVFVSSAEIYEDIDELNKSCDLVSTSNVFDMTFEKTGEFLNSIVEDNYSNRFIKVLKDCFLEQEEAPDLVTLNFSVLSQEIDSNNEVLNSSLLLGLKVLDVEEMLMYSLKEYNTDNNNFRFLINDSESANSQYNSNSIRRLEKTIPALKQIRSLHDFVREPDFISSNLKKPLSSGSKYNEVVAYRLEKVGGNTTGDAFTQNTIQNFWFLNLEDVEEFQFYDNQVKYGEEYTYNVYKYVFIAGIEYEYNGLVLSRTISKLDSDWCLEMFNPETGESASPFFESEQISDLGNTFASDAQIKSSQQYVADVSLVSRPSIKIVEVPIFTKSVTILDAPTNAVGVKPFYYLDSGNKVGFKNRYLEFLPSTFPTAMNSSEEEYRNTFLQSYDLLESEDLPFTSTSMPVELQIYRLSERPNSIEDFDNNLLNSVSLKIPNNDYHFIDKTVVDKIAVNKKYYYLFRIVNELGSPAYNSQVLETTLTDDGGYKFATFEVIFENELKPEIFSNPIKKFKKLFNIVPNMKNIIVDDSEVDYNQRASQQIQNVSFGDKREDLVWDKKYKLRVTSKKTGKKLDINLTFKLNS